MLDAPHISVAIITFNEADRLAECVKSARFANEIVVVDSGSHDGTRETARSLGCKVYEHPFAGFARQKQYAVDRCSHEWVLLLDADERLTALTANDIKRRLSEASDEIAPFSFLLLACLRRLWHNWCNRSYNRRSDRLCYRRLYLNSGSCRRNRLLQFRLRRGCRRQRRSNITRTI